MPWLDAETMYNGEAAVQFYAKAVALGLYPFELELFGGLPVRKSGLVIGCGCGREAFALESAGVEISAIDQSLRQIECARQLGRSINSKVEFICESAEEAPKKSHFQDSAFDFAWLTIGLTGHIDGKKNRIAFLSSLKSITNHLVYLPDVYPRPWSQEFVAGELELRRKSDSFEQGDTLRKSFAKDLKFEEPVKYHFYLSQKEAKREFEAAGWSLTTYTESGYVLKKT